jgi:voltage-gated potassium channel
METKKDNMPKLRDRLYEIIFESDTRAGKIFDLTLLFLILFSICIVMLESMATVRAHYLRELRVSEWVITSLFTLEYIIRLWVSRRSFRYVTSFYGIIDFLAILPTYLSIFFVGGQSLMVIRVLRLLRVFRILKLSQYNRAGRFLMTSLWNSREKIGIFFAFVLTITVIIGTLMYLIEGEENGFTDIPTSIYWAIVTLTTVGYGDLSPVTGFGKFFASVVMILGYAIIAVPTGIVTASIMGKTSHNTQVCSNCFYDKHDDDALYCKRCGTSLDKKLE